MALTVRELIEKLEQVEDKSGVVFIEMPDAFLSVDLVFLDNEGDVTLTNAINSHHCLCDKCKANETKL
ncbi:hypothetical protein bIBBA3_gp28 [Lactococcus phage vB_Llc_bIBBA3]|uniref:Uncharacterized protein n=1 Tax=Lactococcus phage vB_Llc_bIBBA3 TaxID=2305484 RepID=A0A678VG63_9CAUD|nr:hypothetical protein KMC89_gp12 [Lactococcus phage vB_Llc_bIBBA3]AXY83670.1 hypothetical protein bIBBA3_gp28 [Lactococcus phage vB_Llc_bIBBA3]